ncbi:hypothetical protein ADEAN_000347900 [Angomonas deanei]|uniref:Uncharacterized protein n=1 Tax=Angomonas deanei TaxID=59799 RepID=A0A7G2CAC7_9TRYP|nr:hypothetical protein ADEAN_000347900 [Angomonas deanei]
MSSALGLSHKEYSKYVTTKLLLKGHKQSFAHHLQLTEKSVRQRKQNRLYRNTYLNDLYTLQRQCQAALDPAHVRSARQLYKAVPLRSMQEDEKFSYSLQVLRLGAFFEFANEDTTFYFLQHIIRHAYLLDGFNFVQLFSILRQMRKTATAQSTEVIQKVLPRLNDIAEKSNINHNHHQTSGENGLVEQLTAMECVYLINTLNEFHLLPTEEGEHQNKKDEDALLEKSVQYLVQAVRCTMTGIKELFDLTECVRIAYLLPTVQAEHFLSFYLDNNTQIVSSLQEGQVLYLAYRRLVKSFLTDPQKEVETILTPAERAAVLSTLESNSTDNHHTIKNTAALRDAVQQRLLAYKALLRVWNKVLNKIALEPSENSDFFAKNRVFIQKLLQCYIQWSEPLSVEANNNHNLTVEEKNEFDVLQNSVLLVSPSTDLPHILQLIERATNNNNNNNNNIIHNNNNSLLPETTVARIAVSRIVTDLYNNNNNNEISFDIRSAVRVLLCTSSLNIIKDCVDPILLILEYISQNSHNSINYSSNHKNKNTKYENVFPPKMRFMKNSALHTNTIFMIDTYNRLLHFLIQFQNEITKNKIIIIIKNDSKLYFYFSWRSMFWSVILIS